MGTPIPIPILAPVENDWLDAEAVGMSEEVVCGVERATEVIAVLPAVDSKEDTAPEI